MRRIAAPALLVLLLAIPLAVGLALAVLALADSPLESAAQPDAVVGSVEAAARTDEISTTAHVVTGDPISVLSQSAGLITALDVRPGVAIESGTVVMRVDGLPVTAYVSDSPLYRSIASGMQGDDVTIAQTFLIEWGYLSHAADGPAEAATTTAIEAFNSDRGRGENNSVLSVDSLLWVPHLSQAPATLSVGVGTTLAPGAEIYATTATASYVQVAVEPTDAERVVEVADLSVPLAADATTITDPSTVAAIEEYQGEEADVRATVALAQPRQVGAIPVTALVTDANGATCYFPSVDGPAVVVEAIAGSFGMVDVETQLVGTPVLINPRDVRDNLSCA